MNVFDFLAPVYIPLCQLLFGREQHQLLPQALKQVDIHQYSHVLVLGCGPGQSLPHICQNFSGDIVCIDNSPKMIQLAQRRVETSDGTKNNSSITWVCSDVFQISTLLQETCSNNSTSKILVIAEYFLDQFTLEQIHVIMASLQSSISSFDVLNVDFSETALMSRRMWMTALFFWLTGVLEDRHVVHVGKALATSAHHMSSEQLCNTTMFESQLMQFG